MTNDLLSRANEVFAISASACFSPEEDDPVSYDGSMISWTFAANKDARVGAGIYRLQFVRILTPEERNNIPAQRAALAALAAQPLPVSSEMNDEPA